MKTVVREYFSKNVELCGSSRVFINGKKTE